MEVSSLWIGEELSPLSVMCIKSFLKHGYVFNLYVYDLVRNIPEGVVIKKADMILPKSEIFCYQNGSYSAFSNLFRFTMMYKTGEVWVDTDVFCRRFFDFSDFKILVVSEPDREYRESRPASYILKFPRYHEALRRAIELCEVNRVKIESGEMISGLGSLVVRSIVDEFGLGVNVRDWVFSSNCGGRDYGVLYSEKVLKSCINYPIFSLKNAPDGNYFMHLWNENYSLKDISLDELFDGNNILSQMWNSVSDYPLISKKRDRILITGASGLVGSALQRVMKDYRLYIPRSSELNLLDYQQLDRYLKDNQITAIIHLAANVGGLFKNMNFKVNMLEDNLLMNFNVIRAAHENRVKKLISCLSTCIFPDKTTYPINEKMLHDGPPHFSNDAYAYAKRMSDIHSRAYREQYGDNFVSIIPTNIYGPNDNYNLEDAHVIPALIHRCYLAERGGEKFMVKGSGKPLRQFIYSDDLAELIRWVFLFYNDAEPIILSNEEEYAIGDVARLIAKEFNYGHRMEFDVSGADGQYKKTADNGKLMKFLSSYGIKVNWTGIGEGIGRSVRWFVENYGRVRK